MVPRQRFWIATLLALALGWWILWPRPALGADLASVPPGPTQTSGAALFSQHCAGCHVNGGNVIRRGKTLRLAALRRAGLESGEDVARVAAEGQGQMGGYGEVLGPGGAEVVGDWVWRQALADWPKSERNG
jgi:cytochrome c6